MGLKAEVQRREKSQLEALSLVVRQMNASLQAGRRIDGQVVRDARALFKALDKDASGSLSRDEISRGLKRLDVVMETSLFDLLIHSMDLNQDGLVDMAEFLRCLSPLEQRKRSEKGPAMGKVLSDRSDASTAVPVGKIFSDGSTMTAEGSSEDLAQRVAQLEQELALLREKAAEDHGRDLGPHETIAAPASYARQVPLTALHQPVASPQVVTRQLVVQGPILHGPYLQQARLPMAGVPGVSNGQTLATASEPYGA